MTAQMPKGFSHLYAKGQKPQSRGLTTTNMSIDNGYNTSIFAGDPVSLVNGYIVRATATTKVIGTLQGVRYIDSQGRLVFKQNHVAGNASQGLIEGVADVVAEIAEVDGIVLGAYVNDAVTQADIGKIYNVAFGSGNVVLGRSALVVDTDSGEVVDVSAGTAEELGMVRFLGKAGFVGNDYGDDAMYGLFEIVKPGIE